MHHGRSSLAAAAAAEADFALADAVGLGLDADAKLVAVDGKVRHDGRLAGWQRLALQAELVHSARRVEGRAVALVVVGVEVARVFFWIVAAHDAANLAHKRRIPIFFVQPGVGPLQPRILHGGKFLALCGGSLRGFSAHALEHPIHNQLGTPGLHLLVLCVRVCKQTQCGRLRNAFKPNRRAWAAEFGVVGPTGEAAVSCNSLHGGAVKDASKDVGNDHPDGAEFRLLAGETVVALLNFRSGDIVQVAKVGQVSPTARCRIVRLARDLVGDALCDADHLVPQVRKAGKGLVRIEDREREPGHCGGAAVGIARLFNALELRLPTVGLHQIEQAHQHVDDVEDRRQEPFHDKDH